MVKPTNLNRPAQAPIATPYGVAPLVKAAKTYTDANVMGDVRKIVMSLAASTPTGPWADLLKIVGWREPGGRIGLLDFNYEFPDEDGLDGFTFTVLVREIVGGQGEPLAADEAPLAKASFSLVGFGELQLDDLWATENNSWHEWMCEAVNLLRTRWDAQAEAGNLGPLSYPLKRERWLAHLLGEMWSRAATKDVANNLALDLVLVNDEEDAEQHCSRVEFTSSEIRLVTPALARELEERGAPAKTLGNLPLWARDSTDAPHLDRVIQDIVYQKFGQSLRTELASTEE